MGSGPKTEKSGEKTAPAFSVPSAATYSSGTRPSTANTRSPLPESSRRSASVQEKAAHAAS